MSAAESNPTDTSETPLAGLLRQSIAILDGAMGTMIQQRKLTEADFRGQILLEHPQDLQCNNDLLSLTRPDVIEDIHFAYFEAGADLVTTNTFSSTTIAQADYHLEHLVPEINRASAACAIRAARRTEQATAGRRCYVIGGMGPTNRTASMSPDVNRPDYRAITFDQLVAAYLEQARELVAGGVDALMVETIFDTLNAKAALFGLETLFDEIGRRVPVMISVTITDASGRTLSGQTIGAFYNSIRHSRPFSVGVNCALGGKQMRPYIEELAEIAECFVTCHPNAGLPNAFGGYDETPYDMAEILGEFAQAGFVNLVGGCCGSTPDHIRAIAAAVREQATREITPRPVKMQLSGLEALSID